MTRNLKKSFPCILCGGVRKDILFFGYDRLYDMPGKFFVARCVSCGLWQTVPQVSEKIMKRYYPSGNYYAYEDGTKRNFMAKVRTVWIRETSKKTISGKLLSLFFSVPGLPDLSKKGTIVDIGCGAGDTLHLLSECGWYTIGIEPDKKAASFARKRHIGRVIADSYSAMKHMKNNSCDCIRFYSVLEHLNNPEKAIFYARRSLKKNGELIIGIPNCDSFIAKVFGTYWYNLDLPRHLYHFSPQTIRKLLMNQEFSLISIQFISAGGLLGSIDHFLRKRYGFRWSLVTQTWVFFVVYPIEWLLDHLQLGDMMVVRARKLNGLQ